MTKNILYRLRFDFTEVFRTGLYCLYSHFPSLAGVNPSLNTLHTMLFAFFVSLEAKRFSNNASLSI